MKPRLLACGFFTLALQGCNMQADVENLGGYTFLPGAPVVDTPAMPLRHLVLVERDTADGHTLVYYFAGDLGVAGLGLEDLRRRALRHGGFQLRFAYAGEHYAAAFAPHAEGAISGDVDGEGFALSRLDAQALYTVGASRFLRTVDEAEFPVRAYFGVFARAAELGTLRLDVEGRPISYDFALRPSAPSPSATQAGIAVAHAETPRAGELELELSQDVTRVSDEALLETSVVTLLAPDDEYQAPASVVLASFAGSCWSLARPLLARVSQIRQYYERREGGDVAVIERRRDSSALSEDAFAGFVSTHGGEPALAAHCSDVR